MSTEELKVNNKREKKIANKEETNQAKVDKSEIASIISDRSNASKYSIGDKLKSGATVKEVK